MLGDFSKRDGDCEEYSLERSRMLEDAKSSLEDLLDRCRFPTISTISASRDEELKYLPSGSRRSLRERLAQENQ